MGYFDTIMSSKFKKDAKGNTLFYRSRIWGKGQYYIVPDKLKEQKIRRFIKLHSITLIIACGINATLINFVDGIIEYLACFLLVYLAFSIWYSLATARLTKGLAISDKRWVYQENLTDFVNSCSSQVLWVSMIFFLIFLMMSIWLAADSQPYSHIEWPTLIITTLFLGAASIYIGYLINLKELAHPDSSASLSQLWVRMATSFIGVMVGFILVTYRPHRWLTGLSLILSFAALCLFIGSLIKRRDITHYIYLKWLLALAGFLSLVYAFSVTNIPFLEGKGALKYLGLYPKQQNCQSGKALSRYLEKGGSLETQINIQRFLVY